MSKYAFLIMFLASTAIAQESFLADHPMGPWLNEHGVKVLRLVGDPNVCAGKRRESFRCQYELRESKEHFIKKFGINVSDDQFLSIEYLEAYNSSMNAYKNRLYDIRAVFGNFEEEAKFTAKVNEVFDTFKNRAVE